MLVGSSVGAAPTWRPPLVPPQAGQLRTSYCPDTQTFFSHFTKYTKSGRFKQFVLAAKVCLNATCGDLVCPRFLASRSHFTSFLVAVSVLRDPTFHVLWTRLPDSDADYNIAVELRKTVGREMSLACPWSRELWPGCQVHLLV